MSSLIQERGVREEEWKERGRYYKSKPTITHTTGMYCICEPSIPGSGFFFALG